MKGNFFYRRLGGKIFHQRKSKELSQEQLALLSTVNRTYLSKIEKGRANPSVRILGKLARVLRVKIKDLLDGV